MSEIIVIDRCLNVNELSNEMHKLRCSGVHENACDPNDNDNDNELVTDNRPVSNEDETDQQMDSKVDDKYLNDATNSKNIENTETLDNDVTSQDVDTTVRPKTDSINSKTDSTETCIDPANAKDSTLISCSSNTSTEQTIKTDLTVTHTNDEIINTSTNSLNTNIISPNNSIEAQNANSNTSSANVPSTNPELNAGTNSQDIAINDVNTDVNSHNSTIDVKSSNCTTDSPPLHLETQDSGNGELALGNREDSFETDNSAPIDDVSVTESITKRSTKKERKPSKLSKIMKRFSWRSSRENLSSNHVSSNPGCSDINADVPIDLHSVSVTEDTSNQTTCGDEQLANSVQSTHAPITDVESVANDGNSFNQHKDNTDQDKTENNAEISLPNAGLGEVKLRSADKKPSKLAQIKKRLSWRGSQENLSQMTVSSNPMGSETKEQIVPESSTSLPTEERENSKIQKNTSKTKTQKEKKHKKKKKAKITKHEHEALPDDRFKQSDNSPSPSVQDKKERRRSK